MQRIPLNAELRDKLLAVDGKAELVDENGKLLGEFRRSFDYSAFTNDPNWPSEEELDRISQEEPRYTTEQVLECLRKLTKCS